MHSLFPAAFAALAAVATASPVEVPRVGIIHSAPIQKANSSATVNALTAILNTYKKFDAVLPPSLQAAKAAQQAAKKVAGQTSSVKTYPTGADVDYLVPLTIQNKTFNMVLDTGSSDTWVFSNLVPTADQAGHTLYNVSVTPKKVMAGQTFAAGYGDGGHASGVVFSDTVAIGSVSVTTQAVEAAATVSSNYVNNHGVDGLLGLAFSSLNSVRPTQQKTFFENVKASLVKPLFAVTLKKGAVGSLDFGFINATKYTGKLSYMNVESSSGFWEFPLQRYGINGTNYSLNSTFSTIVDTGTSLMYLPDTIVNAYYKKLPGSMYENGFWKYPCAEKNPPMGLFINGTKYTVSGALLNWERLDSTYCYGGLQSSNGLPFAILGDVFLKAVYTVFDWSLATPRVGFARQNPNA